MGAKAALQQEQHPLSGQLLSYIKTTVSNEFVEYIRHATSAKAAYEALKDVSAISAQLDEEGLDNAYHDFSVDVQQPLFAEHARLEQVCRRQAEIGVQHTEQDKLKTFLHGLPDTPYHNVKVMIRADKTKYTSIISAMPLLRSEEQHLQQQRTIKTAFAAVQQQQQQQLLLPLPQQQQYGNFSGGRGGYGGRGSSSAGGRQNSGGRGSELICTYCAEPGHEYGDCPIRENALKFKFGPRYNPDIASGRIRKHNNNGGGSSNNGGNNSNNGGGSGNFKFAC